MPKDFALDYIDVATRIVEFRQQHPNGSLQQVSIDFRDFAGKSWVVFTAAAYRAPDDPRPGVGTAWEPVPGLTPFTRGSEVQNAETAAWGRAIVAALAGDTKRGIASAEEVRNRTEERKVESPRPPQSQPIDDNLRTPAQAKKLAVVMKEAGLSDRDEALAYFRGVIGREIASTKELTKAECSKIIDELSSASESGVNVKTGEVVEPAPDPVVAANVDPWAEPQR